MISETLNTLFLVVNFVKCVFTEVVIVAFKGEVKAKNSIASNEPLCLIKLHILHESDYLCRINTMFEDFILAQRLCTQNVYAEHETRLP